uniref:Uncharacterized protein n=1 Tax=Tetranychus urticae TaxID=32264 RepID=T1JUQ0_TETUR
MTRIEDKSMRSLSSQSREAIVYIGVVLIIYVVVLIALMVRASPVYDEGKKSRRRKRKSRFRNMLGKCQTLVKWEDNKDCPVDPEMGLTKPVNL